MPAPPEVYFGDFFMARQADIEFMKIALQLAERGRYLTAPNPMVGAVIVKNNKIISKGYHHKAGGDHAEIAAFKNAKTSVKGATLYVTLEPCCHTGRTGPCTDAILTSGIKRVVIATRDADPRVKGKGIRILKKAGIDVEAGVLRKDAVKLNEAYFHYNITKRPFIVLKEAQSIDGRIAVANGDSKWISSSDSLRMAHGLRAEADAVIVGMGTVRKDNPSLTVRHIKADDPYRIVLTNSLKFPRNCNLLKKNKDYKTILASSVEQIEKYSKKNKGSNLTYWNIKKNSNGCLDVKDLITKANDFGIRHILVEGGSEVATSFLKAKLVDKYLAVLAPKIIGSGINSINDLGIRKVSNSITFKESEFVPSGKDCLFIGYPDWSKK